MHEIRYIHKTIKYKTNLNTNTAFPEITMQVRLCCIHMTISAEQPIKILVNGKPLISLEHCSRIFKEFY